MIMHSYGGVVGTDAIDEGMALSKCKNAGKPGGVIHLLYLCAFILEQRCTVSSKKQRWNSYLRRLCATMTVGSMLPVDPGLLFFSGMADKEIVDKALKTLVRHPVSALTIPTKGDAYILTEIRLCDVSDLSGCLECERRASCRGLRLMIRIIVSF